MYWCLCWTGVLLWKPHAVCDRDWHTGTMNATSLTLLSSSEATWAALMYRKDKAGHLSWEQNATPQVALCVTAVATGSVQSTLSVSVGTSGWFDALAPMLYLNKWLGSLYVWAACVVISCYLGRSTCVLFLPPPCSFCLASMFPFINIHIYMSVFILIPTLQRAFIVKGPGRRKSLFVCRVTDLFLRAVGDVSCQWGSWRLMKIMLLLIGKKHTQRWVWLHTDWVAVSQTVLCC